MFTELQSRAKNTKWVRDKMVNTVVCPIMSIASPNQPCKLSDCAWFDSNPNVCCILSLATAYDEILEFERDKHKRLMEMRK